MLRRKRVLAAAIETTSGTAETLDATDATVNCFNIEIQANIPVEERPQQGSFSHLAAVPGPRMGTCTFMTYLTGDGAAGVPTWADVFLPACGWVESTQVFSPTTEPPGSNVKTITIGVYEDGVRKLLSGCAGTFRIVCTSGMPIQIEWTFTGVWQAPTDVALLSPTYDTNLPLRFASSTFTVGGSAPGCVQQISFDAGNNVIMRECPTTAAGYLAGLVSGRKVVGNMNPESRLVATENVFGDWLAGTERAISLNVDDGTDSITIAAPKSQRINIQEGDRNGQQIDNIDFQCNRSSGDDELTITFA